MPTLCSSSSSGANNNNWLDVLLTHEACEDIAQEVTDRLELPFVCPRPIVYFATYSVVNAIATQVSPDVMQQIGDAVNLKESGDGVDEELLERISHRLATELNRQIDIPVLDEEQEQIILVKAAKGIIDALAMSSDSIQVDPVLLADQSIETIQTLLGNEQGRRKMAKMLNSKIDFPFLDDKAEEDLLTQALEGCAEQLAEIMPLGLVEVLQGQHGCGEDLQQTKAFLVEKLNQRVDMVGLSEKQEAWLLDNFVDVVVDVLLEGTEAQLLLMSPAEQLEELEERRVVLNHDLKLCRRRYEQERS
ncbi:MAG: hypothetical protein SGARI_004777, partial [Bacillariaceae sp.]